jgi:DUF1680 family protein
MKILKSIPSILFISFLVAAHLPASAGNTPQNPVPASDQFLKPSEVQVGGILGKAISISEQGRLTSLPGWNNGTLVNMFSVASRNANNTTDWYGEHAGKWLYSTALAANRTNSEALKALLFKTADYLVSTQEADGYLGSYSKALRITSTTSKVHKKSWDTWALSYMALGLLQVNEFYPNNNYLNAAKKIGELLLKTFGDGTNNLTDYGTRYGISATIALEPVVELYKITNDKRYLDFAELIVREMENREGLRLVSAGLNNRDMETVADGKAYQIIWSLLGLSKLYEVTGNAGYLKAVQNAWQNILDYHLTITGGPWGGIGKHKECFNSKGFWDPYGFVETCSTMSWIQLNKQLLHLTGEAKYAQEIEKSAYNALLGAQFPNGQDWSYHSFTNGKRHVAHYNDCCPSSGVFAFEELSPLVYTRKQNGIALNLYTASEGTISLDNSNTVNISQKTAYPFDGKIHLTIRPSKKAAFPLFVRIPDWVQNAAISVNGKPVSGEIKSGTYYMLNQDWDKETVIDINFPISLKLVQKPEFATVPQGTNDIYRVNWVALQRGPLVYACSGLINGEDREKNLELSSMDAGHLFKPLPDSGQWSGPAYQLAMEGNKPLVFLPYYEADRRELGGWRLTWLQSSID